MAEEEIEAPDGGLDDDDILAKLPERIRELPQDDPERMRYEQGIRKRGYYIESDGSMRRLVYEGPVSDYSFLTGFLVLGGIIAAGWLSWFVYDQVLDGMRGDVRSTLAKKGYQGAEDPYLKKRFKNLDRTQSLSALNRYRNLAGRTTTREAAVLTRPENPEKGGYLEHIKKKDGKFSVQEATEWLANTFRE